MFIYLHLKQLKILKIVMKNNKKQLKIMKINKEHVNFYQKEQKCLIYQQNLKHLLQKIPFRQIHL
jgi:hypothetical protein